MTYRPDFIDNAKDNTLAKAINAHLAELESRKTPVDQLSIATAYFRPQGLAMLHESLKKLKHMRLLIGAEPLPAGSEAEYEAPQDIPAAARPVVRAPAAKPAPVLAKPTLAKPTDAAVNTAVAAAATTKKVAVVVEVPAIVPPAASLESQIESMIDSMDFDD